MNLTIATSALSSAFGRLDQAAGQVVSTSRSGDRGDLSQAFVGLAEAKTGVRAAAAVVRTADEMTGVLLDIKT